MQTFFKPTETHDMTSNTKAQDGSLSLTWILHEIRNPVTLINSNLQFLESEAPLLKENRHWLQLNQDMHSLIQLLNEYSSFSSCQTLNRSRVNLESLLREVIQSCEAFAEQKHAAIHFSDLNPLLLSIVSGYECDAIKMRELFLNIIKNALEAIDSDGSVIISLRRSHFLIGETVRDALAIDIANDGPPIDPETLEHLFDPFVTTKASGSGVGLTISKKIAEIHGGQITVISDNRGTCFSIILPLI